MPQMHLCPRCAAHSYEVLKTHSYCSNCNFSPEYKFLDGGYDIPPWAIEAVNEPEETNKTLVNQGAHKSVVEFALTAGLLFILSACGSPEPKNSPVKSTTTLEVVYKNSDLFHVEADPKNTPNNYVAHLRWKTISTAPQSWVIQRRTIDSTQELTQLATLESSKLEFIDDQVVAGQSYEYLLLANNSSQFSVHGKSSLTIPKDIEVKPGIHTFPNEVTANRIFFRHGGILLTEGADFRLKVNEIISDDGAIETFRENTSSSVPGAKGRDGGSITITAKTGQGVLRILARGENGGLGASGSSGAVGSKGATGTSGVCGNRLNNELCRFTVAELEDIRRKALVFGFENDKYRAVLNNYFCATQTGDGSMGDPGVAGNKGMKGGLGGDSGNIHVEILDPSQIQIKPEVQPGVGGKGGSGGIGGLGGPGGNPGTPDSLGFCRVANAGPQGPQGPRGTDGPVGENGTTKSICMKLGSLVFGDCAKGGK